MYWYSYLSKTGHLSVSTLKVLTGTAYERRFTVTSKVKFLAISKNQNEKIIEGKKHKPPGKITFLKSG